MLDSDNQTHYEILELSPDASPQDIRAAYLRAKAAYKKDSPALYSLISPEDTEELLGKIEEAYQVLSSPDRRKNYDRLHGVLTADQGFIETSKLAKVVSIDRVPPMESGGSEIDLLNPPSTDFTAPSAPAAKIAASPFEEEEDPFGPPPSSQRQPTITSNRPTQPPNERAPQGALSATLATTRAAAVIDDPSLAQEIAEQVDWHGTFLRRVREARNVAIEELCDYTKITKTYLFAIEEEKFEKLPAAVYLRGFITQIAKYLKLPHEKVAAAYIGRHAQWRQEQEKHRR